MATKKTSAEDKEKARISRVERLQMELEEAKLKEAERQAARAAREAADKQRRIEYLTGRFLKLGDQINELSDKWRAIDDELTSLGVDTEALIDEHEEVEEA